MGIVNSRVNQFEMATTEELKKQIEEEKAQAKKLQEDVELMEMRNQLEVEKLKQQQWKTALDKLKQAREEVAQEHDKCMEEMDSIVSKAKASVTTDSLQWFRTQMEALTKNKETENPPTEQMDKLAREQAEREAAIADIKKQQEELSRRMAELQGQSMGATPTVDLIRDNLAKDLSREAQEDLINQLRSALAGKKETDPNRVMLKALVTQQNKIPGMGGTNTLNSSIIKGTVGAGGPMAEWLANLNRQEEGECELNKIPLLGEEDASSRQSRVRSGILDRATTNIQQRQVWPQQNLGEDWADEDVEFKQMRFKHLVAGETRTIETCTDPAEILGRLRLLRRMAYLKLRGYEWNLIRKMYAAILTSIKTKEYSWESNFDWFETILYRRVALEGRTNHTERGGDCEQGR